MRDEIIKEIKTIPIKNFYILLAFLLFTISLLIIMSIYCYIKKHQSKQEHPLPYYGTSNEVK